MLKALLRQSLAACCLLGVAVACMLTVESWNKVSLVPIVRAQDASVGELKYVDIEPNWPPEAARVVKVTVGKRVVTPGFFNRKLPPSGVPFQAGDEWLKELTFTIKNRSSKTLVTLYMDVAFPETIEQFGYEVGQPIKFGRRPELDGWPRDEDSNQPLDFRPGQEIVISFAPYADQIRKQIEERQPFSTITRCFINVHTGYFADGMVWILSHYDVPDPGHPGKWKSVDVSEYPVEDKRITYAPNESHD